MEYFKKLLQVSNFINCLVFVWMWIFWIKTSSLILNCKVLLAKLWFIFGRRIGKIGSVIGRFCIWQNRSNSSYLPLQTWERKNWIIEFIQTKSFGNHRYYVVEILIAKNTACIETRILSDSTVEMIAMIATLLPKIEKFECELSRRSFQLQKIC